jgi:hypothetical protein
VHHNGEEFVPIYNESVGGMSTGSPYKPGARAWAAITGMVNWPTNIKQLTPEAKRNPYM